LRRTIGPLNPSRRALHCTVSADRRAVHEAAQPGGRSQQRVCAQPFTGTAV
jgi:hypothetical protein